VFKKDGLLKMFVIHVNYIKPLNEIERMLGVHRDHLALYFDAGKLLASGSQVRSQGEIVIGIFTDREECDVFIQIDPFFKNQAAEYTVSEFAANRAHSGAEFILDEETSK
jgi:uncharacterized protein YciI